MNKKVMRSVKNRAWIIICVCSVIFFISAVIVYMKSVPDNVTELFDVDDSWLTTDELSVASGNIENYPYVTRVYTYSTDSDRLNVCNIMDINRCKLQYGLVEDESSEYNYYAEFFVRSNIKDKSLVKRFWNMSVTEGEELTITQADTFNYAYDAGYIGDIKRNEGIACTVYYDTFMRITVKPGYREVSVTNIFEYILDGESHVIIS